LVFAPSRYFSQIFCPLFGRWYCRKCLAFYYRLYLLISKELDNGRFRVCFGIIGMSMGISAFVFAIISMSKIDKLEKRLKELDVINQNFKSS
jgi:hypothetical protein